MTADSHSIAPRLEYRARRRFGSLDGLRAVAVLAVVWHHTVVPADWLPMSARGFLGVDLFFVLSGFLIVTLLLREEEATGQIRLQSFYMRRSLRIFPLYYAILAVMALYSFGWGADSGVAGPFREEAAYHATYLSNWFGVSGVLAISWSLAAEEQFYLVWPPLQRWARRAAVPLLLALLALNQLLNFGLIAASAQPDLEILQVTFTPILLGVGLAFLLDSHFDLAWTAVGHRLAAPALAGALLLVVNVPSSSESLVGLHRLSIHLLMTALVASVVVREDHRLAGALTMGALVRVGAISYGIYLFHMLVRHVVVEGATLLGLDSVPLLLFVGTAVGTVAVADLSFRFFESPILRAKERFAGSAPLPAAAVDAWSAGPAPATD